MISNSVVVDTNLIFSALIPNLNNSQIFLLQAQTAHHH
jgi:hypothetical protein